MFINDLLLTCKEEICNFADDNTSYVCDVTLPNIVHRINCEMVIVLDWFSNNGMVANPDKFQVIFLGIDNSISIKIGSFAISSSSEVKLLGVILDDRLILYPHVLNICGKALSKIKALMRIRGYLNQKRVDALFFSHIMSPFSYCPLVWMFCS